MGAPAAVKVALAAGAIHGRPCTFRGLTVRETAGATATVQLYDSTAASGVLVATIALAANESVWIDTAVSARTGIFAAVTGTIEGTVFIG